jgi:hypothetical protein
MSLLLLALLAVQTPLDEGTFVVRADTAVVARETFRLDQLRGRAGGAAWSLAASARYDRPGTVVLAPVLELAADSQPETLEFDVVRDHEAWRILAQLSPGRFTVRMLGRRSERAREFPVAGPTVVLDDSVYAPYLFAAWRARPQPVAITAIVARAGRRDALTVQDLGPTATTLNRDPALLRHVTVLGGPNRRVDLWLDDEGRLLKVDIPSRGVRVERLPPA